MTSTLSKSIAYNKLTSHYGFIILGKYPGDSLKSRLPFQQKP